MTELFNLDPRVALVTGASSGLGRHFAMTLARHGARVVLAARRMDALEVLRGEIEAQGGMALSVFMDVTDEESVAQAFAKAAAHWGAVRILINNSGIADTTMLKDLRREQWQQMLDTNLTGAFAVAQQAAGALREAGLGGSIINIASILALRVAAGLSAYAVSKAALQQLTRSMALEFARDGIRVNAIAPGYIETDINREFFATDKGREMIKRIPQRRLGLPEDLDGPLLLLASDASAYMTGATLVVDGGHLQSSF